VNESYPAWSRFLAIATVVRVNDVGARLRRLALPQEEVSAAWLRRLLLGLLLLAYPVDAQVVFETTPLAIESASGTLSFEVELAITPEQRRQGLMFRERLDPDQGMLFDFGRTAPVTMWMRNTFIPLDMLFIDTRGVVVRIAENTEPRSRRHIESGQPVLAVLEVIGGTAARLGLAAGDRIEHPLFRTR
jgi:uncharacterized protein